MLHVYLTYYHPVFDHCNAVWGNLNKGLASKIQKYQNRAAHIITSQAYETRSADLLKFLVWDNLAIRPSYAWCHNQKPAWTISEWTLSNELRKQSPQILPCMHLHTKLLCEPCHMFSIILTSLPDHRTKHSCSVWRKPQVWRSLTLCSYWMS